MPESLRWRVDPREGVGPIRLGDTLSMIESRLGAQGRSVARLTGYPTRVAFPRHGIGVSLDHEGRAREIEVSDPAIPVLANSSAILGLTAAAARQVLESVGCSVVDDEPDGVISEPCGIRIWVVDDAAVSVVVFDPEDSPPKTDPAALLERLGIPPL